MAKHPHTPNARVTVSERANLQTGPIYQGEGCVVQVMGTEDIGIKKTLEVTLKSADMESVKSKWTSTCQY